MTRLRISLSLALLALLTSTFAPTLWAEGSTKYLGAPPAGFPKDSTLTIRVRPIAPGVYAAKINFVWTGWVELADGILVIDAGMADSAGAALADTIRARSPNRPFRYLVLTQAHDDHILGAKRFLDQGAVLVAHSQVVNAIDSTLGIAPNPSKEIRISSRKRLGSAARPVDVVSLGRRASSKGDLVVHLPKQRVLFTGDIVSNKAVPWLLDRDFSLKGWFAALDSLESKRFAADSLVPGHGEIAEPAAAIQFTRRYLRDVDEKATQMAGWGVQLSDLKNWGYLGAYEDMEFYQEVHFMNMRRMYNEARGIKTPGRVRVRAMRK